MKKLCNKWNKRERDDSPISGNSAGGEKGRSMSGAVKKGF